MNAAVVNLDVRQPPLHLVPLTSASCGYRDRPMAWLQCDTVTELVSDIAIFVLKRNVKLQL